MSSKKAKKKSKKALKPQKKKLSPNSTKLTPIFRKELKWIIPILLITFIAFVPSLNNEFVYWDDDKNFLENELITSIHDNNFWQVAREIFRTDVIGNYNPLTIFTFAIEKKVFGFENPMYWHLNNILLHTISTLFVFLIGRRLGLSPLAAAFFSILFGIHPMRVESVAWVTERKDVLFGSFYLCAIYYYIKGKQSSFSTKYILIIAFAFILSLLSKIQAVLLPPSLILIDYYLSKESKISLKSILNKWPLFIGSLILGLTNIYFLKSQGSIGEQHFEGLSRLFIGSYQLTIYYIKALIPYRMSPLYPYPTSLDSTHYFSILSFIITTAALLYSYIKKYKVWFFGIGFFIVNVFLLLQIVGAGQGYLADRFTYIAYIGLFFILGHHLDKFVIQYKSRKTITLTLLTIITGVLFYLTYKQNYVWKDSETLWSHVLRHYTKTTLPYGNRANFRRDQSVRYRNLANQNRSNNNLYTKYNNLSQQQISLALQDYEQVTRLDPSKPNAYNSRARLYFNFSEPDSLRKALYNYNKAIELDPNNVEYHVNRGATFAKLGDYNSAVTNLNHAQTIDPNFLNIYLNRSVINSMLNRQELALADIESYLKLSPNKSSDMWYEKGNILNYLKRHEEAIGAFNTAISMKQNGLYYFERGKAYFQLNQLTQAKTDIMTSQRLSYKGDASITQLILAAQ